jgi:hypothetical protein
VGGLAHPPVKKAIPTIRDMHNSTAVFRLVFILLLLNQLSVIFIIPSNIAFEKPPPGLRFLRRV